MKLSIVETLPNGRTATRRFWGVSFHPEKRQLKAAYRPQIVGVEADGTVRTDEDTPAHDLRLQEMGREMSFGDPDFKTESVTRAVYSARIRLFGKLRHVGTSGLPKGAAQLFDSALWHLWGWAARPAAHFNYYRPGSDMPPPPFFPKVKDLQLKLILEAKKKGCDPAAFSFTFAQRNEI